MKRTHNTSATQCLRHAALGGLVLVTLAACQTRSHQATYDPTVVNYTQRHPIVLTDEAATLDLLVGAGANGLVRGDVSALRVFALNYREEGQGALTISIPAGSANEVAARDSLQDIHRVISRAGVDPNTVLVHPYTVDNPGANAPVRVSYEKVTAITTRCGQWPDDISSNGQNADYYNYGCATQSNLAAMIDDPRDLVRPRGLDPSSGARRVTVLDSFVNGEPTQTQESTAGEDGAVSDVAQ